ncbi:MAG: hypothetical protein DMF64_21375 [Acidobacteria bacterium]|nr:MAG: hypothetical protein DMF64_21375 [Acidobacteriota bacterium]
MAGMTVEERSDAGTPPVGDQNTARAFLDRAVLDSAVGGIISLVGEGFQPGEQVILSGAANTVLIANANGGAAAFINFSAGAGLGNLTLTGTTSGQVARASVLLHADVTNLRGMIVAPAIVRPGGTVPVLLDRLTPSDSGNIFLDGVNQGSTMTSAQGTLTFNLTKPTSGFLHEVGYLGGSGDAEATVLLLNSLVDLSVTKSGPAMVNPGLNMTYTIAVTNNGPDDAHNVTLTDATPTGTTFQSFTAPAGWTNTTPGVGGTGTITSTKATFTAGSTVFFTLVLNVNNTVLNGTTISNTATISAAEPDTNPSDNSSTQMTTVSTATGSTDLAVTKTGPATANTDDTLTYTIALTNNGPSNASNVTLTDQVPPGMTPLVFTQVSGTAFGLSFNGLDTFTAQAATVNPGTYTFQLIVQVKRNVLNGTVITNGASASSSTPDPNMSNNVGTASTTITNPTHVVISEFRFHGPAGAQDEFIELYNDANLPLTVQDTDGSGGWAIVAAIDATARCTIPNGTVIPARGHYLCVNSTASTGYSLNGYPAGTAINAVGDASYTTDIPDGDGVGLFTSETSFVGGTLLDAVGFSSVTNPLFREGPGLTLPISTNSQFSFVRKLDSGFPQDTNNNAEDFVLVATDPNAVGNGAQLGAPGPENLFSPIQRNATIKASLIEPLQPSFAPPNRVRDMTPVTNGAQGTLTIRRRFKNATGATITRLRFRVVNTTTLDTPVSLSPQADVRLLTSGNALVTTSLGTLNVQGTLLEQPPVQSLGGGLNSSATVTLPGGGLAAGNTIDVQFLLGVQTGGSFRFFVNIEGLTSPPTNASKPTGAKELKPQPVAKTLAPN